MAVTFDAAMTGGNDGGDVASTTNGSSVSTAGMTIGGSANLLVVCFSLQDVGSACSGLSATWNGVSMTAGPLLKTIAGNGDTAAIFYLINPATGNQTLAGSWTGSGDLYLGCASFIGVDTTTPIVTADNQTSATNVTIPTANGDATVSCSVRDANDPTVSFTKFYGAQDLNPGGAGQYKLSTGSSDAHTFTYSGGASQATVGVHILASAGGGGNDPDVPLLNQPHTYNVYRM